MPYPTYRYCGQKKKKKKKRENDGEKEEEEKRRECNVNKLLFSRILLGKLVSPTSPVTRQYLVT
jgi:hypothetical protein